MGATIRFKDGTIARVDDLQWQTEDRELQRVLQSLIPVEGYSTAVPNRDWRAARDAIVVLDAGKGDIIEYDEVTRHDDDPSIDH